MSRPAAPIQLSVEDKRQLLGWRRRRKTANCLHLRAGIVLDCANGFAGEEVAERNGTSVQTVTKWRRRFSENGMAGLSDAPRSGQPRRHDDDRVQQVLEKTLYDKPRHATHWSVRSLAEAMDLPRDFIHRVWTAFGLKPHLSKNFILSTDPHFVDKVRDVVGLYMDPPDKALVLCVDEKSQIQALERTQPSLPMTFGQAQTHTHNYRRFGTTTLFAALDVATGQVIGKVKRRHRSIEFISFLRHIDKQIPDHLAVHLILDNYGTHKTQAVKNWLLRHPRFQCHFTPTYSSWLNLVERFFASLTEHQLKRGSHRSVHAVEKAISQYLDQHNESPKPFRWTKSADEIIESVNSVLKRINRTGH